jgi:hypothetical protein
MLPFTRSLGIQSGLSSELYFPVGAWREKPITAYDCESGYRFTAEAIGHVEEDGTDSKFLPFLSHLEHPAFSCAIMKSPITLTSPYPSQLALSNGIHIDI